MAYNFHLIQQRVICICSHKRVPSRPRVGRVSAKRVTDFRSPSPLRRWDSLLYEYQNQRLSDQANINREKSGALIKSSSSCFSVIEEGPDRSHSALSVANLTSM